MYPDAPLNSAVISFYLVGRILHLAVVDRVVDQLRAFELVNASPFAGLRSVLMTARRFEGLCESG